MLTKGAFIHTAFISSVLSVRHALFLWQRKKLNDRHLRFFKVMARPAARWGNSFLCRDHFSNWLKKSNSNTSVSIMPAISSLHFLKLVSPFPVPRCCSCSVCLALTGDKLRGSLSYKNPRVDIPIYLNSLSASCHLPCGIFLPSDMIKGLVVQAPTCFYFTKQWTDWLIQN